MLEEFTTKNIPIFVSIPIKLLNDDYLTAIDKLVYVYVRSISTDVCYYGSEDISEMSGIVEPLVEESLHTLLDRRWLTSRSLGETLDGGFRVTPLEYVKI